jgi:NTE family protein
MRYRLGLVLSGGGSRGLAHAGVLKALVENGLGPEAIAGTSSGALVGALHGGGYQAPDVLRFFETTSPFRLSRLAAFRKPGWIDTEKIAEDFRSFFPGDSFEDLSLPLFVTATDLVQARLEIFSSGPLIRPLVASASIPLVFTPIEISGRLFADGGILDNFPIEPLASLCDVVIGVHVSPRARTEPQALDNSIAVAQRALEIGMFHVSRRKFHFADLVISPPALAAYGTFDQRRHREILDVGYQAAVERIEEIRLLLARR